VRIVGGAVQFFDRRAIRTSPVPPGGTEKRQLPLSQSTRPSLQGDDRCPERDQPSSKRRESGFELFVIGLKSCWVMNLDEGDKIGRHYDCGLDWGRLIGHGCDSGLDFSPAAARRSALKRRYRTDAMLSHLRHICGPRSAPKTSGPASVAVPPVRHRYPTQFYMAACRKEAIARS
jgi:hypothetical protein